MENDRGAHGMRAPAKNGGVSSFVRAKDKKVIAREVKHALSRAIELLVAAYPAGKVPELAKGTAAEIIGSTLNRLAAEGQITRLLPGRMYAVHPETLGVAIVRDPSYIPEAEHEHELPAEEP